eukprot:scaffold501381_cov15-Prasinocladus_malaysianus.AAC.1
MAARAEAAELEAGQLRMRLQAQGTLRETRSPEPAAPVASPASRYASHEVYASLRKMNRQAFLGEQHCSL